MNLVNRYKPLKYIEAIKPGEVITILSNGSSVAKPGDKFEVFEIIRCRDDNMCKTCSSNKYAVRVKYEEDEVGYTCDDTLGDKYGRPLLFREKRI